MHQQLFASEKQMCWNDKALGGKYQNFYIIFNKTLKFLKAAHDCVVEHQDLSTFWSLISSARYWTTENKLAKEQAQKQMSMANFLLRTCLYRQTYNYLLAGHLRIQQQRILLRRRLELFGIMKNVCISINQSGLCLHTYLIQAEIHRADS